MLSARTSLTTGARSPHPVTVRLDHDLARLGRRVDSGRRAGLLVSLLASARGAQVSFVRGNPVVGAAVHSLCLSPESAERGVPAFGVVLDDGGDPAVGRRGC